MRNLISLLFCLCFSSNHAQNSGICAGSVSHPDYYEQDLLVSEHLNETNIRLRATPNYFLRLKAHFKVACQGEYYRVLIYYAIVDGTPFVYDVRCKNCEGSAHEWMLRKILHTTKFEVVGGSDKLPQGMTSGIMLFTVTPLKEH